MEATTAVRHRDPSGDVEVDEARRMFTELVDLLDRRGELNIGRWAEQMAACGWPISTRQLHRFLAGHRPVTEDQVEQLAIAAGIDLAYLYPDVPIRYVLTARGLAEVTR